MMNDVRERRGANATKPPAVRLCVMSALLAAVGMLAAGCAGASAPDRHRSGTAAAHSEATTHSTLASQSTTTRSTTMATVSPPGETRAVPLAARVVVVDPGHNGGNANAPEIINRLVPAGRGRVKPCNTTGTESDAGYSEAAFNWDVALRLQRLLVAQGARVVMTRHNNSGVGPCVNERAAIGNRAHADAVIAIHADGGPPEGRGFQVIYAPDEGSTATTFADSLRLAQDVHRALLASGILPPSTYDGHDGYSVRNDLAGLNLSTQPAILVELGNMRNSADASLQSDSNVRQRLAEALASGLDGFLAPPQ